MSLPEADVVFIVIFSAATLGAIFVILANAFGWYPYSKGFTAVKPPKNPAESKAESVKGGGDTTGTTKEPMPGTVDRELKPATITKPSPTPIVTTGGGHGDHGPPAAKEKLAPYEPENPTQSTPLAAEAARTQPQNDRTVTTNRDRGILYETFINDIEEVATHAQSLLCSIPPPHAPETAHPETRSDN